MITAHRGARLGAGEGAPTPDDAWRRLTSLIGDGEADWSEGSFRRIRHLTEREFEVFVLLGRGLSNQAISRLLLVTERTVKAHVTRVLAKLQVDSRLQAGLVAQSYTRLAAPNRTYGAAS
ncbi:response regulator transcription factor [Streptomyces sp. NPDC091268]|uniref:response regulator transcription factor n=1 Tax=Streptomyces sp. NPDC091268 TaxID=3365979 RepID=UPI00380314EC